MDALFKIAKTQLRSAIETKLAEFPVALVETHGKDLTVSAEPSRSGTPANGSAASNSGAAPSTSTLSKPEPAKPAAVRPTRAINTEIVTVEATFQAAADDLYNLFTDEARIPAWSRAPAQVRFSKVISADEIPLVLFFPLLASRNQWLAVHSLSSVEVSRVNTSRLRLEKKSCRVGY